MDPNRKKAIDFLKVRVEATLTNFYMEFNGIIHDELYEELANIVAEASEKLEIHRGI